MKAYKAKQAYSALEILKMSNNEHEQPDNNTESIKVYDFNHYKNNKKIFFNKRKHVGLYVILFE